MLKTKGRNYPSWRYIHRAINTQTACLFIIRLRRFTSTYLSLCTTREPNVARWTLDWERKYIPDRSCAAFYYHVQCVPSVILICD